jgi:hypothetical protein
VAGGAAQPETKYARLGGHRIAYQVGRPLPEHLPPDPLPPWEAYAEELDAVMDAVGAERAALLTAGAGAGRCRSGEVLVSRTVRDLVTGSDMVLEDRGPHHLKGVEGAWQLFAVGG